MKTMPLIRSLFVSLKEDRLADYESVCKELEGINLQIKVDREVMCLCFSSAAHRVLDLPWKVDVYLSTTGTTLRALVRGQVSLLDAIEHDQLDLKGQVQVLAHCHDAFCRWLIGVMGCREVDARVNRWLETGTRTLEGNDHVQET